MAGARKVIAIEKDSRAIDALADGRGGRWRTQLSPKMPLLLISPPCPAGEQVRIVANLPYNIATTLLLNWLGAIDHIAAMTLMFQREVGQRITASPGNSAYGRLSVISQWLCETVLFDIPPQAFVPPPKVTSSVVGLTPEPRLWQRQKTTA